MKIMLFTNNIKSFGELNFTAKEFAKLKLAVLITNNLSYHKKPIVYNHFWRRLRRRYTNKFKWIISTNAKAKNFFGGYYSSA